MDSQYYSNIPPHHSSYPHYPENPNPPSIYHHLPPPQSSYPHPPGVESYSYHYPTETHMPSTFYPHTFVAKDAIRQYGPPPPPPANVGYNTVMDSLYNNSIYSVDPSSLSGHPLADGAIPSFPKKTEASQPMRCEVCKLDCNSKDVLDRHMLGKKHRINMALQPHAGELGIRFTTGSSVVAADEDLETKRRKLLDGGAAVDSVMTCSICKVVCNNEVVYNDHIAGKKHAIRAGLIPTNSMVPATPIAKACTNSGVQPRMKKSNIKGPIKPTIVQSAWCEICGIDCNSQDVLEVHKKGKKHQKNLEKLNESKNISSTPASTSSQITNNPIIGPQENPKKKAKKKAASAPEEDVETKRQKVVSGGAAADAVRVCSICNVVCNSQLVFNYHLTGQKHTNKVKKQAEVESALQQSTRL